VPRLLTRATPFAVAALAVGLVLPQQVRLAQQKAFWLDEAYEWTFNCAQPVTDLIVRGAVPQCSPAPGYYLLQKLVARAIAIVDERILVTYRAVSLAASGLLILTLCAALAARLGPPAALAALASLVGQPLFHAYATESRPYALGLALFACVVLLLSEGASRARPPGPAWSITTILAGAACSLVLLTGAAQAVVACATGLVLARARLGSWRANGGAVMAALLALGAACAAYYRAQSTCLASDAGPLSVWGPQGPKLVSDAVGLIWTDRQWVNVLALVGCAAPFRAWRRQTAERSESWVLALGAIVLGQTLLALALAAQVAWADYYFLPRLFLHLVVCRALLVGLGVWLLLDLAHRLRMRAVAGVVSALLAVAATWISLGLLGQEVEERSDAAPWRRAPSAPCAPWAVPLTVLVTDASPLEQGPNLLVEAAHEARRCGWTEAAGPGYLMASPEGPRVLVGAPPAGSAPLRQCGRQVSLDPRPTR
jgi:hypothetical protein